MTLEETIKNMEQVIDFSCDEDVAKHKQKIAYLKELQDIKENSIVIPNNSTEWEAARALIDAGGMFKTWSGTYKTMKVFDTQEIAKIGKHLMNYASVEETDE